MSRLIKGFNSVFAIMTVIAMLFTNANFIYANETSTTVGDKRYYKQKLPDIDVTVNVNPDLVAFTQNVTSNNSYLEKIGASNVEQVRALLQVNNIYLELIPAEGDVVFELLLSGKAAPANSKNFNELSDTELKEYFDSYIASANTSKNSETNITEKIDAAAIENINGVNYFVTDVTSVAGNLVTVKLKKFYTIIQDKAIVYTLQTNQPAITDSMLEYTYELINSAVYAPLKKSIFDNVFIIEFMTSFLSQAVFVGILALIVFFFVYGGKKKKYIR